MIIINKQHSRYIRSPFEKEANQPVEPTPIAFRFLFSLSLMGAAHF